MATDPQEYIQAVQQAKADLAALKDASAVADELVAQLEQGGRPNPDLARRFLETRPLLGRAAHSTGHAFNLAEVVL